MKEKKPNLFANETFINLNLDEIISDRFGKYAKYIIQDRALPDARDGLKPVQRRILHAMNGLGLTADKPYKKSARTVGEVIGKFHPHGDSSIYEAMVRMAQDWKNNWPLIDMHGNKGSIDGDSAAAMRYTETRLSAIAATMLSEIEKDTVRFVPNFDDSETEPSVLPAALPNLLINGAAGIAAGYATNMPPHNLNEVVEATVARIDSPNCRLESILKVLKGPDLPTGGTIQGAEGIATAYATGKGRFIIRSKIAIETKNGIDRIVVTEIPYETSKASIVKEIDEIRLDAKVGGIEEVRDESDRTGIRVVIDIKKGAPTGAIKAYLLKNTALQIAYSANLVAIVDRKPVQATIFDLLDNYIKHRLQIITAAAAWDLAEAVRRKEIVEGLIKAVGILDDVVETIRRSADKDDAKDNLQKRFAFTPNQSEAIVQLRLYRLTSTNIVQLEAELVDLTASVGDLTALLGSDELRRNKLKADLRALKKQYDTPRRSVLEERIEELKVDEAQTVAKEKIVMVASRDGYVKRVSQKSYDAGVFNEIGTKLGDIPVLVAPATTLSKVVLLTSAGNFIALPAYAINEARWKDEGFHLNETTSLGGSEKIVAGFVSDNLPGEARILALATVKGMIKRVRLADLGTVKTNKPSTAIKLEQGDALVGADLANDDIPFVGMVSRKGIALAYAPGEISLVGPKAAGVKAMNLVDDELAGVFALQSDEEFVTLVARRGAKRIKAADIPKGSRNNKGKEIVAQLKSSPIVVVAAFVCAARHPVAFLGEGGRLHFEKNSEIPIGGADSRVSALNVKGIVAARGYDV